MLVVSILRGETTMLFCCLWRSEEEGTSRKGLHLGSVPEQMEFSKRFSWMNRKE
jgi:hypothetical protein